MEPLNRLLDILKDVAEGHYSNDVDELTGRETEETVRAIAETVRVIIARIKAREKHMEMLQKHVEETSLRIRQKTIATVTAMARALAARDAYTKGHSERVSLIAGLLSAEMGAGEEETELIQLAGLLHDIGKIGFPDYLFLPHDKDPPEEIVREIRQHPITGAEILKDLDFLGKAISYIRYHHERPDGLGYPYGLHDADIPLGAKIIAVSDSFDAITTDRPYQRGSSFAEALAILERGAGTKWDMACVAALRRVLPKIPHPATVRESEEGLLSFTDDRHEILLEHGPAGGARMRWLKPGIDFNRYTGFLLDPITFFLADDSEYKGMDPQDLKNLADLFHRRLKAALKESYSMASAPGPHVARLHFAITDLRQNRPDLTETGASASRLTGLNISWGGSGATCAEMIVFDSTTSRPIAAAKDERRHGLRERFTQWGAVEDAFQYWADRLSLFLEQSRKINE